jgi:uncharacterized membrane protein YbjE (DUF340 family)
VFDSINVLKLIVPLAAGILLGYSLQNRKLVKLDKVSLAVIIMLIFSLGFGIGSNNELLNAMPKVGFNALIISVLTILFSIAFVKAGRRMVRA